MLDVSVVVCARNAADLLPASLASVAENDPGEVIVVDGRSDDDTVAVAQRFGATVLQDHGKGLAFARNLGAKAARCKYVAFVGPDNILPVGTLGAMVAEKERRRWAGVSAQTRLHRPQGYLARSMDRYKGYRFTTGERSVIGTPTLFDSDILKSYLFDAGLTHSDDADLSERMVRDGHRLGIASVTVLEHGMASPATMLERWRRYGQSDAEFYRKYSSEWTAGRKMRSLLHPVRSELVLPAGRAIAQRDIAIVPFLVGITLVRYAGWVASEVNYRRNGAQ